MNKKYYIYGASYPDILKILESIYKESYLNRVAGFIDDVKYNVEDSFMGVPIVGETSFLKKIPADSLVINNVHSKTSSRFIVNNKIIESGFIPETVICPETKLNLVTVGSGVFLNSGVVLGANVCIGNGVSIKIGASVSHDVIVNDYAFIGPKSLLCGHVNVGKGAYIGAGAIVKERVNIGEGAIVGAGAIVLKDVLPWTVVVGNPAKKLRSVSTFNYDI